MRHASACLVLLALVGATAVTAVARAEGPKLIETPADFPTLVNPNCSHCKDEAKRRKGELKDDERVLCWIRGKYDGGAIPFRFFLNRYRVISDTYGVFVYDADAGFARAFAPSLDFKFHGFRNGILVIKHKDGTLYSALSGRAFAGPRKGGRLQVVPAIHSNWGWWLKRYPDTVAYHLFAKYKPEEAPSKANASSVESRGKADPRLPADERVLGVVHGKHARAYRIADLKKAGVLRDEIDGVGVYLLYHEKTGAAAAYLNFATIEKQEGKQRIERNQRVRLEFVARDADAPFRDNGTSSSFDIAGRGVAGKLKGWTLDWVDSVEVKWFAWAAEHPRTTVYGQKKKP
jgi:hypothetical protein